MVVTYCHLARVVCAEDQARGDSSAQSKGNPHIYHLETEGRVVRSDDHKDYPSG
jgi:hypothetical protein